MARKQETLVESLILAPWWVSLTLAPIVYVVLAAVIPGLVSSSPTLQGLAFISSLAPIGFFGLLGISAVSAVRGWKVRQQFDAQTSVDSLCTLHWKEFEDLVAEYFRREGYQVTESLGGGPDGGIDVKLKRDGATTLVQCKRWKNRRVQLPTVRELLGAMTAERAERGVLVTTSSFTSEARNFAENHSIQLIDGFGLLQAIGAHRSPRLSSEAPAFSPSESVEPPACPTCGTAMTPRKAKRGKNPGASFWGCPDFPRCRGTRPVRAAVAETH